MNFSWKKFLEELRVLIVLIIIAFSIKSTLVEIMESAMDLNVPLVADAAIGENWAECK